MCMLDWSTIQTSWTLMPKPRDASAPLPSGSFTATQMTQFPWKNPARWRRRCRLPKPMCTIRNIPASVITPGIKLTLSRNLFRGSWHKSCISDLVRRLSNSNSSHSMLPVQFETFKAVRRFNSAPVTGLIISRTFRMIIKRSCKLIAEAFLLLVVVFRLDAAAQYTHYSPDGDQIPGPECLNSVRPALGPSKGCSSDDYKFWLDDVTRWRRETRLRAGYSGQEYERQELQWTQASFIQPQMMVEDRYFYDPVAGKYTVDKYLDDLEKRYGGIDAVLIWPTYPNMGVDDRNEHDLIRSMPGGVAGVKQMIADFHHRGVRVLFPMMMWDQGTRDPGLSWPDAIANLMAEIGADGINGDTQDGVPLAFSLAADKTGHPLAFEPEGGPADEALAWNVMTWGQYQFPFAPLVDKYKWLETRHMVNISDRWNRDKTNDLQFAFFNGVGWESWENVWGIWNGITPRDGEATRRVATIERAVAPFLVSPGWEPLAPMLHYGVFASRWPLGNKTLWTIVNRNEYDVDGNQIEVSPKEGLRY